MLFKNTKYWNLSAHPTGHDIILHQDAQPFRGHAGHTAAALRQLAGRHGGSGCLSCDECSTSWSIDISTSRKDTNEQFGKPVWKSFDELEIELKNNIPLPLAVIYWYEQLDVWNWKSLDHFQFEVEFQLKNCWTDYPIGSGKVKDEDYPHIYGYCICLLFSCGIPAYFILYLKIFTWINAPCHLFIHSVSTCQSLYNQGMLKPLRAPEPIVGWNTTCIRPWNTVANYEGIKNRFVIYIRSPPWKYMEQ